MKIPETNIVLQKMPVRTLNYARHGKLLCFVSEMIEKGLLFITILFLIIPLLLKSEMTGNQFSAYIVLSSFSLFGFLGLRFWSKKFFKKLFEKKIYIYPNYFLIVDKNEEDAIKVEFGEVTGVEQGFIPFLGMFTVKTKERSYYFSGFLHRAEKLLEELHRWGYWEGEDKTYTPLRYSVICADHRLSRVYESCFGTERMKLLVTYILVPFIASFLTFWKQLYKVKINFMGDYFWNLLNIQFSILIVCGIVHFFITEGIFYKSLTQQLDEDNDNKKRDKEYEEKVYRHSLPIKIFFVFICFYSVLMFDVNQFGYYQVFNSSSKLNILKNDMILVDKRYNCMRCEYSLRKGEKLVFIKDNKVYYGKITNVALSRNVASFDNENIDIKFGVIMDDTEKVIYVENQDVLGKALPRD
ncbi:MAG: hypothetical protein ACPGJV_09560 [Bacteriovoracaceae bacterium]